jgi:hypothetical protein
MKRFLARFVAILAVIILSTPLCKLAYAQIGFSVQPSHIDLELEPGESQVAEVRLENKSNQFIEVKAEAKDFAYDKKGKLELLSPEDGKYFNGCAGWVCFKEISRKIGPRESAQFRFRARAPKKVKGGLYQTYLIFSTFSKKSNVRVVGEIASLLKIKVPGGNNSKVPNVVKKGKLVSFKSRKWNFGSSVPFVITFENRGNVELKAGAIIEIRDGKGRLVEQISLPKKNIKANQQEIWTKDWKAPAILGRYRAIARIDENLEKSLTKTNEFWVIKWQLISTIVLLVIGAIIFGVFIFPKLKIERKTKE